LVLVLSLLGPDLQLAEPAHPGDLLALIAAIVAVWQVKGEPRPPTAAALAAAAAAGMPSPTEQDLEVRRATGVFAQLVVSVAWGALVPHLSTSAGKGEDWSSVKEALPVLKVQIKSDPYYHNRVTGVRPGLTPRFWFVPRVVDILNRSTVTNIDLTAAMTKDKAGPLEVALVSLSLYVSNPENFLKVAQAAARSGTQGVNPALEQISEGLPTVVLGATSRDMEWANTKSWLSTADRMVAAARDAVDALRASSAEVATTLAILAKPSKPSAKTALKRAAEAEADASEGRPHNRVRFSFTDVPDMNYGM
jgi:hypothetical protein